LLFAKGKLIARKLEEKAITLSQGDIANLITDFGPKELMLEEMAPAAKMLPLTANNEKQIKAATA